MFKPGFLRLYFSFDNTALLSYISLEICIFVKLWGHCSVRCFHLRKCFSVLRQTFVYSTNDCPTLHNKKRFCNIIIVSHWRFKIQYFPVEKVFFILLLHNYLYLFILYPNFSFFQNLFYLNSFICIFLSKLFSSEELSFCHKICFSNPYALFLTLNYVRSNNLSLYISFKLWKIH